MWAFMCLAIFVMPFGFIFVVNIQLNIEEDTDKRLSFLKEYFLGLWYVYGSLIGESISYGFFCCSWLLFSFVIGSSFSGLLKANTFLPPISNNINSFEDIISKGTTKAWVLEDDGYVDTYGILHGNSSDMQKFQSKVNYVNYLNMTHDMHFQWLDEVSKGNALYIGRKGKLEKYINAASGESNIYMSEEILPHHLKYTTPIRDIVCNRCWNIYQFTPWKDLFQMQFYYIESFGISKKLGDMDKANWKHYVRHMAVKPLQDSPDLDLVVRLKNLTGVFYILLAGLGISITCLCIEKKCLLGCLRKVKMYAIDR